MHNTVAGLKDFWLSGCFCLICFGLLFAGQVASASNYEMDMLQAARSGDSSSQYGIALVYEYGGVEISQDRGTALHWFEEAGKSNVPGACFYLGLKYEYGNGVPKDLKKAACLYECAARQDWPAAQYFLASMYEKGKGVQQSIPLALAWFDLAAQWGYPGAASEFSRISSAHAFNDLNTFKKIQGKLLREGVLPCP
jgi:TPR repeat protein